jgi:siroheme synthase (precorrin-2 oxidase/ferrochelatase)
MDRPDLFKRALGANINVLVNIRTGGNAPLIAQMIAEKFLQQN